MTEKPNTTTRRNLSVASRHGNLFIGLAGDFTPATAGELLALLSGRPTLRGNIFVNTEKLTRLLPTGREAFRQQLPATATNLYFIGAHGFALSPEGGRVIVRRPRKKQCRGCGNCRCGRQRAGSPVAAPAS